MHRDSLGLFHNRLRLGSLSLERETSTGVLANLSRELANLKREFANFKRLSGTGDSQRDSHGSIRANHSQLKPLLLIARQADSHESLEFPIRANHPIRANRANRFARITPLRPKS